MDAHTEIGEHRGAWYSMPEPLRNLMHGGFGSIDGTRLYDDRGRALEAVAQDTGCVVKPCVLVLTEANERVLLYIEWDGSHGSDLVWQRQTLAAAVKIAGGYPHIKIARPLWEIAKAKALLGP